MKLSPFWWDIDTPLIAENSSNGLLADAEFVIVGGAIAVAAPAYRINARLDHTIKSQLIITARSITAHWGGRVPTKLDDVWDEHSKAASEIGANE